MTGGRKVLLAPRLQAIADLVPAGESLCDVGCDHAHIPLYLLKEGRIRRALAMDVIPGPLQKAADNLALFATEEEREHITLRLSDGLDAYAPGEAQILVIAGMGGWLMRRILLREPLKTGSFSSLVLQPQSDPEQVRDALRMLSFVIEDERIVVQDGKFYQALRAVPAAACPEAAGPAWPAGVQEELARECEDRFGPVLLRRRDPILHAWLTRCRRTSDRILASLRERGRDEASREKYQQMTGERERIEAALYLF